MYRQYPYNSDTHPRISNNSFNILGLHYITILNEEEVAVNSAFWHHTPGGPCIIHFNFHKIPAGRNYICLCMIETEVHNRLYMDDDDRHYHIRATREVNKYGMVGMILQFIPKTHRANPEDNRLWTSRVPTLQFLAAGYISEEESATMHHLPKNSDTDEMDCLRKKCFQIEIHYKMPANIYTWGNLWIPATCEFPEEHHWV